MKKVLSFKIILSVAVAMTAVSLLSGLTAQTQAQATDRLVCSSVTFRRGGATFGPDQRIIKAKGSGYEAFDVAVEITVTNRENNVFGDNYKFFYYSPGDDAWYNFPLQLDDGQHNGSFTIKAPGTWKYQIQTGASINSPEVIIAGTGQGCSPSGGEMTFDITVDPSTISNAFYDRVCEGLDDEVVEAILDSSSHFNCLAPSSVGGPFQPDRSGSFNCGGSIPDAAANLCIAGRAPDGTQLDQFKPGHCYPCAAVDKPIKKHLEDCDGNLQTSVCDVGLKCLPTGDGDPLPFRCVVDASATVVNLNRGESCHMSYKSTECNILAGLTCVAQPGSLTPYFGKCDDIQNDTVCVGVSATGDQQCVNQCKALNPDNPDCDNYKCQSEQGTLVCKVKPPEGDGGDSPDPIPQGGSNQFGICNCPGLECLDESGKVTSDPRLAKSSRNKAGLTEEEAAGANSCKTCITAGKTWTDSFGCIDTTPSGLFIAILRIALGTIGGVTLFRLIILGYVYNFTDKKKDLRNATQEVLSALGGLLLVLFSIVFLRVLGVNILDIVPPGFFGN